MMADTSKARREVLIAITGSPAPHGWRHYVDVFREAMRRGAKFRFVLGLGEKLREVLKEVEESAKELEGGSIEVKIGNVLQPFFVIDERISYVCLTDPIRRKIVLAIRVDDEYFSRHMKNIFELLWEKGSWP